jgi:hypothetical protein
MTHASCGLVSVSKEKEVLDAATCVASKTWAIRPADPGIGTTIAVVATTIRVVAPSVTVGVAPAEVGVPTI